MDNLSVTILTKNSERYIYKCLESVKAFNEVIILDNGSSDNTLNICREFGNVKIFTSEFIGFGPLKNLAASYAENDWILSLDSDEVVSKELLKDIQALQADINTVYSFPRDNYYKGRHIKCCGWYPDNVLRIYNRTKTSFNLNMVHESIIKEGIKVKRLKNAIKHFSYDSIEELIEKMQRYSTLYAEENTGKKKSSPLKAALHSLFCFFNHYILKKGIFYGYRGFLISFCNANNVFFKYMKLYEKNLFKK